MLASELLGKCDIFWLQLTEEIDSFYQNLETMTYGKSATLEGNMECWEVVLTMVRVI